MDRKIAGRGKVAFHNVLCQNNIKKELLWKEVTRSMNQTITIHVKMDKKILRSFALFDTFRLKKHWKRPALFALIMLVFALVCLWPGKQQSALLGCVLLIVGLLVPFSYVFMFLSQLKEKAQKLRLDPPRKVYSLAFSSECIRVVNDMKVQEEVRLEWQKMGAAFRVKNAIYLYMTRDKAFILPDGQADASAEELWAMIVKNMPEGRASVKSK